ncbi:MAG: DsrE/DsrF/DrsH-like family protein [Pirellulaceae bacterium]
MPLFQLHYVARQPVNAPAFPTPTRLAEFEARIAALEEQVKISPDPDTLNLLVFSGERDRLLAAFVMACSAAASGMKVVIFFTFWGTPALRKSSRQLGKKTIIERAFGWMLPGGVRQTRLSNMDMLGMGRWLMAREMKKKGVADLPTLIESAQALGVELHVCEMSMNLMGIRKEELIDYEHMRLCGAAEFIERTTKANTTMFI